MERENLRLRWIGAACTVGAALLPFYGAHDVGQDGVLKGEGMLVTNKEGDSSIAMGTSPEGEPVITFQRTLGGRSYSREMRMLVAGDGVPVLEFVDQGGTRRFVIPR